MSNMSYCRFRNTKSDLLDCKEALERLVEGSEEALGREELDAATRLMELCREVVTTECDGVGLDYPVELDNLKLAEAMRQINANLGNNHDQLKR